MKYDYSVMMNDSALKEPQDGAVPPTINPTSSNSLGVMLHQKLGRGENTIVTYWIAIRENKL